MCRTIAFLHTSPTHIETFDRLVNEADPSIEVQHLVAEDLLLKAQQVGADDPLLTRRVHDAMLNAASRGAAIVVCTCSTIGGAAENTPSQGRFVAARIDRAMGDRAVTLGRRVLLVAALESALNPTGKLIQESAATLRSEVELEHFLIPDAWSLFQQGDREAYIQAVAAAVRRRALGADVVVLAQASLAPAVALLNELRVEVLASPALGVRSALAVLRR